MATCELIETYNRDGTITARGHGVLISPLSYGGHYQVRTTSAGGSKHGRRYVWCANYQDALDYALGYWRRNVFKRITP